MKAGYTRVALDPKNEAWLLTQLGIKLEGVAILPMLKLVSQVCDARANGQDCYITIGATRTNNALLLTLNVDGSKLSVAGATLMELGKACEELL